MFIYEILLIILKRVLSFTIFYKKLKDFAKKCKNGNYCKVMKGLLEKIHENSKCIEERRSKATFSLKSTKEVVNTIYLFIFPYFFIKHIFFKGYMD